MNILTLLGGLFGIGKDYLKNRQETKRLKQVQGHEIIKAQTKASVDRIMNNTESDNSIDLITAKNKKYTLKDEVITYLFLLPVAIAASTPFLIAHDNGLWIELNEYTKQSWQSLNELPTWYKWVLGAIVIDVLGFRSFARKLTESKTFKNPFKK